MADNEIENAPVASESSPKRAEKWLDPEKLRFYRLKKGAHKLKNRSSKDILRLNHCNNVRVYPSFSNAMLDELSKNNDFNARVEIDRRRRKAAKKAAK